MSQPPEPIARRPDGERLQRGQALVETLVVLLALVPLLLAIPLLAKYQDIRHAAVAAARTAAYECSVRFEQCGDPAAQATIGDGLRRRHFARHSHDLLSRDAPSDDAAAGERNRFWVDRRGAPLLARFSDVALQITAADSDALAGALVGSQAARAVSAFADAAGPGAFGLETAGGLITTRVAARVSTGRTLAGWLQRPEGLELTLAGRSALLVDAWNASSANGPEARSHRERVALGWRLPSLGDAAGMLGAALGAAPPGGLGPIDADGEVEPLLDALYAPIRELITGPLLAPVEPRGRLFRYHEIDVDLVPEDRLGGSAGSEP
ncbi:MAG: hypothetical protein AB7G13_11980 [Lautropia sp.]